MKNLIVLAVAALFATNAVAAEMKWNGSAGWRYSNNTYNDNLDSKATLSGAKLEDVSKAKTVAHQVRANLGVTGGWEHVEYGFGVRTKNAANDDYTTVNAGTDLTPGIDQAWFRYVHDLGGVDIRATIGRQVNALATNSTWETLFDNDTRWDGFGWNFKFGMFGLNATQYILGAMGPTNGAYGTAASTVGGSSYTHTAATDANSVQNSKFLTVFAFQPYMNWKFSDEIEAMLAVSYLKWNTSGYGNTTSGGYNPATTNVGASAPAIASGTFNMDNKSQWDVLLNISLPYNLAFSGEYVKATKAEYNTFSVTSGYAAGLGATKVNPEVSSAALNLGLTYGKLRKAQDFTIGYAYGSKGIGSVINTFSNDKFLADNKGHQFMAGYALADNFNLGFKANLLEEKERIDTRSSIANGGGLAYDNVGSTNAGQKLSTTYWEVTAGVAF